VAKQLVVKISNQSLVTGSGITTTDLNSSELQAWLSMTLTQSSMTQSRQNMQLV